MNTTDENTVVPFETDYVETRGTVRIPRDSIRKRILAAVVRMAERFQSEIFFSAGDLRIDGKSPLMAFILLDALKGQTVEVSARGPDSAQAVQNLSALFHNEGGY